VWGGRKSENQSSNFPRIVSIGRMEKCNKLRDRRFQRSRAEVRIVEFKEGARTGTFITETKTSWGKRGGV